MAIFTTCHLVLTIHNVVLYLYMLYISHII